MLPNHYRLGLPHLARFHNVHAALGLHPLRAKEGQNEVDSFVSLSRRCNFIGEIGLDFSSEGKATKEIQLEIFSRIVDVVKGGKFVSVHSRDAALDLLQILDRKKVGPVCFHYFTAGPEVAAAVVEAGHYFSFNRRMLNGKHKVLLDIVPKNRVLVESDSPFLTTSPITATRDAYTTIAGYWQVSLSDATKAIAQNFAKCRTAT
jgi:TatD DNase family protein